MSLSKYLVLLIIASLSSCTRSKVGPTIHVVLGPPSVDAMDTCVYPGDFIVHHDDVTDFHDLNGLPLATRKVLDRYLDARLGRSFVEKLRFREGAHLDPAKAPDVQEDLQARHRQFVAYVLIFDTPFLNEEDNPYCAGVHLDPTGEVVMDIGLPRIASAPQKSGIISKSQALEAARQAGLTIKQAWLRLMYEPHVDILVWQVSHTDRAQNVTTCNIDAHTGRFVAWNSSHVVY